MLDASGNLNAGIISGAVRTASGRFGRALEFDGLSNWVTIADSSSLDLTSGMTLEAWVFPTAAPQSQWRVAIAKEQDSGGGYFLAPTSRFDPPGVGVFAGGQYSNLTGGATLPLNQWTHIAGTYDGSALRLYVNGTLVGSAPLTGAIGASTGPLRLGGDSIWGEFFAGRIDEVRIYNRALSTAEIQADRVTPVVP